MTNEREREFLSRRRFCLELGAAGLLGLLGCNRASELPPPKVRRVNHGYSRLELPVQSKQSDWRGSKSVTADGGWAPAKGLERAGRWHGILVHHSASEGGSLAEIDNWHKKRGWDGVGYHFVINNGHGESNGKIEVGFRWHEQREGAHCRVRTGDANYWNEHTIGICLVGDLNKRNASGAQYASLAELVRFFQGRYRIGNGEVRGHCQVPGVKTDCPGRTFSWSQLRGRI